MVHDGFVQGKGGGDRYRVVSLFSGAGGLDVGLDRTGRFELLSAVELEPTFCRTLEINRDAGHFGHAGTAVVCADLSTLDPFEFMDELGLSRATWMCWSVGRRASRGPPRASAARWAILGAN